MKYQTYTNNNTWFEQIPEIIKELEIKYSNFTIVSLSHAKKDDNFISLVIVYTYG